LGDASFYRITPGGQRDEGAELGKVGSGGVDGEEVFVEVGFVVLDANGERPAGGGLELGEEEGDGFNVGEPAGGFGAGVGEVEVEAEVPLGQVVGVVGWGGVTLVDDPDVGRPSRAACDEVGELAFELGGYVFEVVAVDVGEEGLACHGTLREVRWKRLDVLPTVGGYETGKVADVPCRDNELFGRPAMD
jgi:hypothetical protein